jgi:hypothetical protein
VLSMEISVSWEVRLCDVDIRVAEESAASNLW